jgi:hypothetical protein
MTGKEVRVMTGKEVRLMTGKEVRVVTGKGFRVMTGKEVRIMTGKRVRLMTGKGVRIIALVCYSVSFQNIFIHVYMAFLENRFFSLLLSKAFKKKICYLCMKVFPFVSFGFLTTSVV